MKTASDQQLLEQYAATRSDAAFAELVRRHLGLVHSAALRMTRNPHTAEDVAQGVFTALAKNARKLSAHPALPGWLHQTTRNLTAKAIRTDVRRRERERQAFAMQDHQVPGNFWGEIAPHLDEAIGELRERERDALILRYFEKRSAHEIAKLLDITPEAAQKRVSRAVESLRVAFARRGITTASTGVTATIASHAVQAAPESFTVVIAKQAVSTAATATLLPHMLAPAAMVLIAGLWVLQHSRADQLRREIQAAAKTTSPAFLLAEAGNEPDSGQVATSTKSSDPSAESGATVVAGAMVDGEWLGFDLDPDFTPIDSRGRPTTDAVERLELTDDEIDSLTTAVWRAREVAAEDFVARIKHIRTEPTEAEGQRFVYQVPASADRGRSYSNALAKSFRQILGNQRANLMRPAWEQDADSGGVDEYLGGVGRFDLAIEFTRNGKGELSVKWVSTHPETGELRGSWEGLIDSFEECFGGVFEFPDSP